MEQATLSRNATASLSQAQINMAFGWELAPEARVNGKHFNKSAWQKSAFFALLEGFPYSTLQARTVIAQDNVMKALPYPCLYGALEKSDGTYEAFAVSQFVVMQILSKHFGFSASYAELSPFEIALLQQVLKPKMEINGAQLTLGTNIHTLASLMELEAVEATLFTDNHNDSAKVYLYCKTEPQPVAQTDVLLTAFQIAEDEFHSLNVGHKVDIGKVLPKTAFVYHKDQLRPFALALKNNQYTIEELQS
jgi:hypothetical protein